MLSKVHSPRRNLYDPVFIYIIHLGSGIVKYLFLHLYKIKAQLKQTAEVMKQFRDSAGYFFPPNRDMKILCLQNPINPCRLKLFENHTIENLKKWNDYQIAL